MKYDLVPECNTLQPEDFLTMPEVVRMVQDEDETTSTSSSEEMEQ